MTAMARTERHELCDTALQVGEDRPTLCGDWTVKDLVAHLVVRESRPEAVGIVVPQLSGLTDRAMRRVARRDFPVLVERLRQGPPLHSPFRLPGVDRLANTVELFVHHEDIRRAQPGWTPRALPEGHEDELWRTLRRMGRGLLRKAESGVLVEHGRTGERAALRAGHPELVVRGLPGELLVFLFGRQDHADVEVLGPPEYAERLRRADLGV